MPSPTHSSSHLPAHLSLALAFARAHAFVIAHAYGLPSPIPSSAYAFANASAFAHPVVFTQDIASLVQVATLAFSRAHTCAFSSLVYSIALAHVNAHAFPSLVYSSTRIRHRASSIPNAPAFAHPVEFAQAITSFYDFACIFAHALASPSLLPSASTR
eukprot:gene16270-11638_t